MARLVDAAWSYWAVMTLVLSAQALWPAAAYAAIGLGVAQTLHFYARSRSASEFEVQVRLTYLGLLAAGLLPALGAIHWAQLVATLVRVSFDYCALARTLALMPWNRSRPLTLAFVRRAYLTPPTQGSILALLARAK